MSYTILHPNPTGPKMAALLTAVLPKMRGLVSEALGVVPDNDAARMLRLIAQVEGIRNQLAGVRDDSTDGDGHTASDFWFDILEILQDEDGACSVGTIFDGIATRYQWSDTDMERSHPLQRELKWRRDVRLALTQLSKKGWIQSIAHATWALTAAGKAKVSEHTVTRTQRD